MISSTHKQYNFDSLRIYICLLHFYVELIIISKEEKHALLLLIEKGLRVCR